MYLENYYILKSNFFLLDKMLFPQKLKNIHKIYNLSFKVKLNLKTFKSNSILIFLLLSFLNSFIFKHKYI